MKEKDLDKHEVVRVQFKDSTGIITLTEKSKRIDLDVIQILDEVFNGLYHSPVRHVELDLRTVVFVTSLALGRFVAYHKDLSSRGCSLSIVNVNEPVYSVFETTHLAALLGVKKA